LSLAGKIRDNNAALEAVLGAARLAAGTNIPELFPLYNAVPMLFYMAAPPVGWTEVSDAGDTLIAVKGGSTYTAGATLAGSWTVPEHILTIAEIPAHTHTHTLANITASRRTNGSSIVTGITALTVTGSTGDGEGHSDGATWRPAGRVCVLATKN